MLRFDFEGRLLLLAGSPLSLKDTLSLNLRFQAHYIRRYENAHKPLHAYQKVLNSKTDFEAVERLEKTCKRKEKIMTESRKSFRRFKDEAKTLKEAVSVALIIQLFLVYTWLY